jgi:hypothetical protein
MAEELKRDAALETPVALLIFNRPDLTAQVFEAVRAARPKRLLVVADGPRNDAERARCEAARAAATKVDWECRLETNFSDGNLGCKRRVSSGIDWIFEQCEDAIILEDDCLPAPSFFPFCEKLLRRYRDDERVMAIGGTNLDTRSPTRAETYFFTRYGSICGWASWRRAWKHYDVELRAWPEVRRSGRLRDVFDRRAERWYWTQIFDLMSDGAIDTWDYQWYFARFFQNGLVAVPSVNMVANLGFRSDATHTPEAMPKVWEPAKERHDLRELVHPPVVVTSRDADRFYFDEVFNPRGLTGLVTFGLRQYAKRLLNGRNGSRRI